MHLRERYEWHGRAVRWQQFGHGPPIVVCHGTPWSSWVWRDAIATLSVDHSVYAWDMVGYGQSDKRAGDVSLAEQGRLLTALAEHWDLDRPIVLAHDIGGAVALRAHLLHAMSVSGLVLVDVVALRPWGSPFFRLVAQHADVFEQLPMNLHAALVREYVSSAGGPALAANIVERLIAPWVGSTDDRSAFYRQIAQADERHTDEIEPLLSTIDVPTLIIWGADDQWIPVDRATTLHERIPNSELRIVDGAGHLIHEQQPDALGQTIERWVGRHSGESS